jgi:branched-chain amino acid aminotransferase
MAQVIPFDDRDGTIWYDGKLIPWREAKTHVLTHGLHYGSCVFEGERYYAQRVYRLKEHTDRLFASAEIMGMKMPYTKEDIVKATAEVIESHGYSDGYVRPVAFRGSEMMAVSAQTTKTHVAVAVWQWPSYFDPATKMKGIRIDIADWKRPAPDCAPCKAKAAGLYMICTLSKHAAETKGYADALMLDYRGFVAEGTGANIMFVKDGTLHTPTPDCFLNGITRRTVEALAKKRQIPVVERHIEPKELADFSEAFFAGTAAEVTPISEIGPYKFKPGAITETLMKDYSEDVHRPESIVPTV